MRKQLKDFFTFEKRGQKGIFLLILILMLQLIILYSLNFYNPFSHKHTEPIAINPHLLDSVTSDNFLEYKEKIQDLVNDDIRTAQNKNAPKRFMFNPNTLDDAGWRDLGLNKNQIKSLRKYFENGGYIDYPEEVLKIRAVNQTLWSELIPYIELPQANKIDVPNNTFSKEENAETTPEKLLIKKQKFIQSLSFEINTINKKNLKQLELIDSLTIEKLMRYKKALGGFVYLNQIYEIENIDTANFHKLKSHLTIDTLSIKTININTCTVYDLSKHPYITYNVATAIINYRNTHGKYKQLSDLKKCMAVTDVFLLKMKPYFRFSDE